MRFGYRPIFRPTHSVSCSQIDDRPSGSKQLRAKPDGRQRVGFSDSCGGWPQVGEPNHSATKPNRVSASSASLLQSRRSAPGQSRPSTDSTEMLARLSTSITLTMMAWDRPTHHQWVALAEARNGMRVRIDGRFISLSEALAQRRHRRVQGWLVRKRPVGPLNYPWPPNGLRWVTRNGHQKRCKDEALQELGRQIQMRQARCSFRQRQQARKRPRWTWQNVVRGRR